MIQDISPQRLFNEFIPTGQPKAPDIIICVQGDAIMVGSSGGNMTFPRREDFSVDLESRYLFSLDERGIFLAAQEGIAPLPGFSYMTLREIRRKLKRPLSHMYVAYTAWHLAEWYRDSRFCGRCGQKTNHSAKERAMVCPKCGHIIYPRIVPAVIAGVINGDKILMTKYANRDLPYYALVAGFVEIGETLEECVAREVMEEAGLRVKNIRYYKSQPWGNVQDILMGFYCDVDGEAVIRMDKSELKEAVWVKREEIQGQYDDWSLTHHMMITFKEGREPKYGSGCHIQRRQRQSGKSDGVC